MTLTNRGPEHRSSECEERSIPNIGYGSFETLALFFGIGLFSYMSLLNSKSWGNGCGPFDAMGRYPTF